MNPQSAEHEPKYNLGWVVRQSGLTADTIRAWEKRYGVPNPQRTSGNQRMYSDYDLRQLHWLHAKTLAGVQISKAVELWQGADFQSEKPLSPGVSLQAEGQINNDEMQRLMHLWVDACINLDDQSSGKVLDQAFSIFSHPLAARYVVFAGVKKLEAMWLSGEHSSHYLYYARQAASRKIYSLMGAFPAGSQTSGLLVLATVMEEEDPFRPVYLAYLTRMAGWKAVNAGPQMIAGPLYQTILETHASGLVMVANHLHTAANAYGLLKSLQEKQVAVFFCGTFFERHPELQQQFPGVFLAESWEEQMMNIGQVLPEGLTRVGAISNTSCMQILAAYQQVRMQIEQQTQQAIPAAVLQDQHFAMANYFMQRSITAAMTLGNLTYLEEDLVWIHRLISNMGFGNAVMPAYARMYQQAVEQIGEQVLKPLSEALTSAIQLMHD